MSRNLSEIYDAAFFESYNEEQEADIRAAADVIVDVLRPGSALDVGCGPGMMVWRMRQRGVDAIGIDGSIAAMTKADMLVRPWLRIADCSSNKTVAMAPSDVVVCTEVAEHVPESEVDGLIVAIVVNARQWIVFTAAPPGQGGHDHINEQPMSYWIDKFEARGFDVDEVMTEAVRVGWLPLKRCWYYAANVRVFRKST